MTGPVFPRRAVIATIAFSIAGLGGFLFAPPPWEMRVPNAVFYGILVLNTFYSVRYFDALPPQDRDERIIDTLLAVNYLVLAAAIGAALVFALLSSLLFAGGIVKYALLLPILERREPLIRKMRINGLGLAMCAVTAVGILYVDPLWSAWGQAMLFTFANIYLLWISPMYADRPSVQGDRWEPPAVRGPAK